VFSFFKVVSVRMTWSNGNVGLLDRVLRRPRAADAAPPPPGVQQRLILGGRETLEVVGESHYQDVLWRCVGGDDGERVRCQVEAVLIHEPTNPHDGNAIAVLIEGEVVGYLCREDAAVYLPGLRAFTERHRCSIGLEGHIVGGGQRPDGRGMLGVFLDHDPADFGLRANQVAYIGELRTGLSEAIATDLEDDRYDLSWFDQLSGSHGPQDVVTLRRLLENERDPIDRHFMFAELAKCLYKSRDAFASALDEFDVVCEQHHAEMEIIRPALVEKFGCVPIVEMYRQAAIRCQKARDWPAMATWTERGLAFYGTDAARPEVVEDLRKRLAHAHAKMAPSASSSTRPKPTMRRTAVEPAIETLVCVACGSSFERPRTRGRKPHRCPTCRGDELAPTP
jgi:predicted Zn-ribbon and HTH transcriptional regulator